MYGLRAEPENQVLLISQFFFPENVIVFTGCYFLLLFLFGCRLIKLLCLVAHSSESNQTIKTLFPYFKELQSHQKSFVTLCHFAVIVLQFNCGSCFTSDFGDESNNMTGGLDFSIQMCRDAIWCVSDSWEVIGEWTTASSHNEFAFHLSVCIQETNYWNALTI